MQLLLIIWNVYVFLSVLFTTVMLFNVIKGVRNVLKKEKNIQTNKDSSALVKLVYVEQVNDHLMAFDALTKSFIAQAETTDALWIAAQARFPNYKLVQTDLNTSSKV